MIDRETHEDALRIAEEAVAMIGHHPIASDALACLAAKRDWLGGSISDHQLEMARVAAMLARGRTRNRLARRVALVAAMGSRRRIDAIAIRDLEAEAKAAARLHAARKPETPDKDSPCRSSRNCD